MKVTLFLMTQKGFEVLKYIILNEFDKMVSEVIIGRDKNIANDYANDMIEICNKHNIKCYERKDQPQLESDYSITISWRWLLKLNNSKLIVLHDSLLPKYRGFAPLVNALINKEPKVGVTAIFASDEYDKGDIIAQATTDLKYPIKIADAINLITSNYTHLIHELFVRISKGEKLYGVPQNHNNATYSLWRDEQDYKIDWTQSADSILLFINALSNPYKGAFTIFEDNKIIRIYDAELVDDVIIENRNPGKIIFISNGFPTVVCGVGLLKITNAFYDENNESFLPVKKLRIRFA